ncbi:MAG: type II toxin-antitoxin system RelE/ParE family toxin [Candidatus Andersenbacteria bacterium]
MKYIPDYSSESLEFLEQLDQETSVRIAKKIAYFCAASQPLSFAKGLTGKYKGLFRFRIGDYRAIFRLEPKGVVTILFIIHIAHRSRVYDK